MLKFILLLDEFRESQIGDLEEEYKKRFTERNSRAVRRWFWVQVISMAGASLTRPKTARVLLTNIIPRRSMNRSRILMAFIWIVAALLLAPHAGFDIIHSSLQQIDSLKAVNQTTAANSSVAARHSETYTASAKPPRRRPAPGKSQSPGLLTADLNATPIAPRVSEDKDPEPRDFRTLTNAINAALTAAMHNNPTLLDETVPLAKRALMMVESHEVTDETLGPRTRDEVIAWLNRSLAICSLNLHPEEALNYLYKTLQYDTFKQDPYTYYFLAVALAKSQYTPLFNELKSFQQTRPGWTSSKEALLREKIKQSIDRIIDAAARFLKLAKTDPTVGEEEISFWREQIREFYKFRNSGFTTGLDQYIDGILTKPLDQSAPHS